MIYTYIHPHITQDIDCVNKQYFGDDAINLKYSDNKIISKRIAPNINKKCRFSDHDGIIIGFENNESYNDYYYIIYIPETREVAFRLCNDTQFVKSIERHLSVSNRKEIDINDMVDGMIYKITLKFDCDNTEPSILYMKYACSTSDDLYSYWYLSFDEKDNNLIDFIGCAPDRSPINFARRYEVISIEKIDDNMIIDTCEFIINKYLNDVNYTYKGYLDWNQMQHEMLKNTDRKSQ